MFLTIANSIKTLGQHINLLPGSLWDNNKLAGCTLYTVQYCIIICMTKVNLLEVFTGAHYRTKGSTLACKEQKTCLMCPPLLLLLWDNSNLTDSSAHAIHGINKNVLQGCLENKVGKRTFLKKSYGCLLGILPQIRI